MTTTIKMPEPVYRRRTDAEALDCANRLNRSFPPSSLKDEAADHIRELVAVVQAPAPAHGGPHLRKQAARLLAQLADNRPRRALDLDATRQLLEAIAAPSDADKLIADLTRNAWEWGVSCEIDNVRWGEAGDSHNQMWRDKTAEAGSRLRAALLTAAQAPAVVAELPQPDPAQEREAIEAAFREIWTAETYKPLGEALQQAVWLGFVQGHQKARGVFKPPVHHMGEPP